MAGNETQFHGTPRFRIVSRIGVGSAGAVYKAVDESRGAFVAIRTLAAPSDEEALRREFRALRNVRHPSLVSLGELDRVDGQWFYSMELVEGESLLDYVRPRGNDTGLALGGTGELAEVRLRSALGQLVRGVAALHEAGRVHGNIEPDNVRVNAQGRLVMLEASLLPRAIPDPASEMRVVRSLPFLAPERLEDAPASPASDWYGVGAVLYTALTAAAPFVGSGSGDLVEAKRTTAPTVPRGAAYPEDLASLCEDLLSIDVDERPTAEEVMKRLQISGEREVRPSQTFSLLGEAPPFLGRKRELGLLAEAFERTRHGAVSTLCLYGESGLGKRTLSLQLARRLRNDYPHLVYLSGRCDREGPRAYRGVSSVIDSLSRYLATQDAASVATLLPPHAPLLPRMFPAMHRVPMPETTGRRVAAPQEPPAVRRACLMALRGLLRNLSKRHPVLVVIDDMQWADPDALSVIDELIRPPEPPDVLLLLLVSGELRDAGGPFRQWLARMEEQITHMRLRELGRGAAKELSERLLEAGGVTDNSIAATITEQAGGHPLRIDALARHRLLSDGSAPRDWTLPQVLRARTEQLPDAAQHLLRVVCYARVPLPPDVAAEAAQLPSDAAARHTATLRVANVIRILRDADGDRLAPQHQAVRHAMVTSPGASAESIANLHRHLALAMSGWAKAPMDVLAAHWLDAGSKERAARALASAADRARDTLAFDAAVRLYQEALAFAGTAGQENRRLRTELAHAYAAAGHGEQAARTYVEATSGASPAEALELERRAAHQLLRTGHIADGLRTVESVLERLGVKLPTSSRAALLSLGIRRARLAMRGTKFRERDASQIPPNDLMRADILGSLSAALGMVDNLRGADSQTRYLLLALNLGDPVRVARALALEAGYQATTSDRDDEQWQATLERARALTMRTGDPQAKGLTMTVQSTATFLNGRWRENLQASADAEEVLTTECTDVDWELGNTRVFRAISQFYLGELKSLSERVTEQIREAKERGDHYTHTNLRVALGYVPLLMGNEPNRAASMLEEAIGAWSHSGFQMQHFFHLQGLTQIELYARTGNPYARIIEYWPALVNSHLLRVSMVAQIMRHLRGRAALAQARVDRDARESLLRDASDSATRLIEQRQGFATGWGYALRAGIEATRGHRRPAVHSLEQAEAEFYESDMGLYAAAARYQLGETVGGDRGKELSRRAVQWFEGQGVRQAEPFIKMLLPGFAT